MPKPALNFTESKKSKAVAYVKGGDDDKQILFLHEEAPKESAPIHSKEIRAMDYETELRQWSNHERVPLLNRLTEYRQKNLEPEDIVEPQKVKDLYKRILDDERNRKVIDLTTDSMFVPIPSPDEDKREVWYIAGASGAGKSYFARNLAEAYKKLYPDREIYLISKLNEDETLDNMKIGKPKRIKVESLLDHPPELEEFRDCMILLDDYDAFGKPFDKVVHQLIDDIASMGRHTRTTMCCMTHHLTNYSKTRLILNEATHIVVYPQATAFAPLKYLLKQYVGLDEKQVKKLKNSGSRWVAFKKTYPQYIITEHSASLLADMA